MGPVSRHLHPVLLEDFEGLALRVDIESLRGTRWVVTGATGFVAAYWIRFLGWLDERHRLGLRLSLWVRSPERARALFPWCDGAVAVDFGDPAGWPDPACDYLVHAASPATPAACRADPAGVVACNVTATQALLGRMDPRRLRAFLFLSSSEVYGDTCGDAFPAEGATGLLDPASPRSLYPLCKKLGEALCHEALRARGVPVRIVRLFHTYGPGMDLAGDGRVFADLVGNAVRGEDIVLRSDGTSRRAFCYLADAAAALWAVLARGENGGCYNAGNPDAVLSVGELADLLAGLAPRRGLRKVVRDEGSAQSASGGVFPNVGRLRGLGWEPRIGARDGFARTIRSYTT